MAKDALLYESRYQRGDLLMRARDELHGDIVILNIVKKRPRNQICVEM